MTVRPIVDYPAGVLRQVSKDVTEFDVTLERLANDMFETMYDAKGVGLAASQVGVALRLFVMDCDGLRLTATNPEIISEDGEQTGEEGCLSIGSIAAELQRPQRVVLTAQDLKGNVFEREATDLAARCFMHETDHCNGVLFINHLSPLRREMVKRRFRKLKTSKTKSK